MPDQLQIKQLRIQQINNLNNEEPVFYCKHCLSLKVRNVPGMEDSDYCDECGSTNIEQTSIHEWEKLYKQKYGHSYLEKY